MLSLGGMCRFNVNLHKINENTYKRRYDEKVFGNVIDIILQHITTSINQTIINLIKNKNNEKRTSYEPRLLHGNNGSSKNH